MIKFFRIMAVQVLLINTAIAFTSAAYGDDLQNQLQNIQQAMNQQNNPPATATPVASNQTQSATTTATNQNQSVPNQPIAPVDNNATLPPPPPPPQQTMNDPDDPTNQDLRNSAFARMTNSTLPLSPTQIEMLHSLYEATQKAAAAYPGIPPRPTSSLQSVNLSPGATPPIARLGTGFVTSLVFVDSTGAPWPIQSYSTGNPMAFNVQWDKNNILLVQAITAHRIGNLAVILKGLDTPVMVQLQPGQAAMDMRVDLRIPGAGPNAKPDVVGLPSTGSPVLLSLLDNIPPSGSKALKSSNCDQCAWLYNGKLYLRTQYTVLSPAWISTMSSADGTNVYEMQPTPIVLASYNGKTIKMVIEGF